MRTPSCIVAELETAFVHGKSDRELLVLIRELRAAIDGRSICDVNTSSPACPDCGAVDCERAHGSQYQCSSGFMPGYRKVCDRCGRMDCTANSAADKWAAVK